MNLSNKAGKIVMKPSFTDKHNAQDAKTRFDQIPGRIILDTCALQYIQDFGEYIFDNYQEDEEYFLAPRGSGSGGLVFALPPALQILRLYSGQVLGEICSNFFERTPPVRSYKLKQKY